MDSQPQRSDRRFAFIPALMRVADEEIPVMIANASTDGLMARCDAPPEVGARVEIARADVRLCGEVMWRSGRRFGLRSENPLDRAALVAQAPPWADDLILAKGDRVGSRIAWPKRRKK